VPAGYLHPSSISPLRHIQRQPSLVWSASGTSQGSGPLCYDAWAFEICLGIGCQVLPALPLYARIIAGTGVRYSDSAVYLPTHLNQSRQSLGFGSFHACAIFVRSCAAILTWMDGMTDPGHLCRQIWTTMVLSSLIFISFRALSGTSKTNFTKDPLLMGTDRSDRV
jgi:hypothetical protein